MLETVGITPNTSAATSASTVMSFSVVSRFKGKIVAKILKTTHIQEGKTAEPAKAGDVVSVLKDLKLEETFIHMAFPSEHWTRIRTNNAIDCKIKTRISCAYQSPIQIRFILLKETS